MKKHYDIVFLTNTPSFYKLNLCEAIARSRSVLLVLFGYGAEAVNREMSEGGWHFDHTFINEGDSNTRSKLSTLRNLLKLMRKVDAGKVLYSGWLAPEYNLYAFLSPCKKNVVVCESSIHDVDLSGIKGWIKRRIIGRMSAALPSGQPHDRLFTSIGFHGPRYITGSVGIFNKPGRTEKPMPDGPLRYLYVGRLTPVKNLPLLVETFNRNGLPLTIVGKGEQEAELKALANDNITFAGFIPNDRLGEVYQSHDVFILPSYSETWGLVVEEAIYWRLPVIVSNRVGSGEDMVAALGTGEIFHSGDSASLQQAIDKVASDYPRYRRAVDAIDFDRRDRDQVNAYLSLFND